jgi:uncharacterized cupredoxin-like copper-binding protein
MSLLQFAGLSASAFLLAISTALADAGHSHIGEPGKVSAADRTVTITMHDNYYEPESLQVKAGETIRFIVKNEGELLHEFSIGTAATHAEHQKHMAMLLEHGMLTATAVVGSDQMDHAKTGDMSMKEMRHDDPNSVLVEPGSTEELVWIFPNANDLEFACNIPGHYESGMAGEIKLGG